MSRAYDIVIVGGGVCGCAIAFELAKRSIDVLLIDKSLPGRATSASAGGLWPVGEAVGLGCGVIYHAAQHGASKSELDPLGPQPLPDYFREFLISSNRCFPSLSQELRDLTGIDIEYEPGLGLLFAMYDEREREMLDQIVAGLPDKTDLELLSADEAAQLEPKLSREIIGGALIRGEYQVNPMLLAEALKCAAVRLGARFRGDSLVTALRRQGDRVQGIEIGNEFIPARTVINAAGAWATRLAATVGFEIPVIPVRGQIVLTETLPAAVSVCLSTSQCYLAQKRHGEILVGSTTEAVGFDVSVTRDAIRNLCRGATRILPFLRGVRVKRMWAGLRPGTPDELPILGPMEGVSGYVNATGGFRTGIVAAPLTGKILAELITAQPLTFPITPFLASRLSVPQP